MGGEFGGEWVHAYVWLHPLAIHLKPSQHSLLLVLCLVAQSCPTLCCDPTDFSPPGFSVHGDSPGKNIRGGCHALLQGIFPTPESKWSLLHCRRFLNQLSYQRSPSVTWLYPIPNTKFKINIFFLMLCPSKKICWNLNPQNLTIWSYLEKGFYRNN